MISFACNPTGLKARLHEAGTAAVRASAVFATAVAVAGCTIADLAPPPLTGPSELGMSVMLQANPDVLTQDGASQSQITIFVRDANAEPLRNVALRIEIMVAGILADFGRLSARNVVTGADGRAFVTYTAPPAPPEPVDLLTVVSLLVTPSEGNFANANARAVAIRLVPPGILLPPNGPPVPAFTFSQPAEEDTPVQFDASASRDDGQIVSYEWDFGDTTTGIGVRPTHTYALGGTYSVTLTVTDDRGLRVSITQPVTISTVSNPIASFTASPTTAAVDEDVFFNASASQAAPGRTIVDYEWTFGDGVRAHGVLESHSYSAVGSYNVVLTVTDDAGKTGTTSTLVIVGEGTGPTASFVFSPTEPLVDQVVNFNATSSTAPAGRRIRSYSWDFGDGGKGTGGTSRHTYRTTGTFVVSLVVTDSEGATDTASAAVTVTEEGEPDGPTADFTFSPSSPDAGDTVQFNASISSPGDGATITKYEWDFGDGGTGSGRTATHTFAAPDSYTVTLVVTNSRGQTSAVSKVVDVD
jgi:PKD repeat protein